MRRVLVTGATGFIGRRLVDRLSGGCSVVAAVRRSGGASLPCELVTVGDIGRDTPWDAALGGVDAVVHLAAMAHRHRKTASEIEHYRAINTLGTLALAEAAARHGVKDFVFVSSIAVNGISTDGRPPFRETDIPRPIDVYAVSKAEAETGLHGIAGRGGMACTIVRPPLVYGIGASGNIALLRRAFARGLPLPLASIHNRRAFVGIGNLTGFIAWRLAQSNRGVETFIVADDGHLSTPDFISDLASADGRTVRLFPVPPRFLAAGLKLAGRGGLVDSLMSSLEVDTSAAQAAGWRAPYDTRTGLRQEMAAPGPRPSE